MEFCNTLIIHVLDNSRLTYFLLFVAYSVFFLLNRHVVIHHAKFCLDLNFFIKSTVHVQSLKEFRRNLGRFLRTLIILVVAKKS